MINLSEIGLYFEPPDLSKEYKKYSRTPKAFPLVDIMGKYRAAKCISAQVTWIVMVVSIIEWEFDRNTMKTRALSVR